VLLAGIRFATLEEVLAALVAQSQSDGDADADALHAQAFALLTGLAVLQATRPLPANGSLAGHARRVLRSLARRLCR